MERIDDNNISDKFKPQEKKEEKNNTIPAKREVFEPKIVKE